MLNFLYFKSLRRLTFFCCYGFRVINEKYQNLTETGKTPIYLSEKSHQNICKLLSANERKAKCQLTQDKMIFIRI